MYPNRGVRLNIGDSVHDPTDPIGRLLFTVLSMIAEFRGRPRPGPHSRRTRRRQGQGPAARKAAQLKPTQEAHLVASFSNIERNIVPEDCFLSRQIVSHPHDDPAECVAEFIDRLRSSRYYSANLYAASLPWKVRAGAVEPIFTSMVDLSDQQPLMEWLFGLPAPRMLMYGEQNNTLSYLPALAAEPGVELAEIGGCGHFPMYANAPEMWRRIHHFVTTADQR